MAGGKISLMVFLLPATRSNWLSNSIFPTRLLLILFNSPDLRGAVHFLLIRHLPIRFTFRRNAIHELTVKWTIQGLLSPPPRIRFSNFKNTISQSIMVRRWTKRVAIFVAVIIV